MATNASAGGSAGPRYITAAEWHAIHVLGVDPEDLELEEVDQ